MLSTQDWPADKPQGKINLREASIAIGKENNFLARQRTEGNWPKGIKLTRKRTALYMDARQLDVLRKHYESK